MFAYNMIKHVDHFSSLVITKVNNNKYFVASFITEAAAQAACSVPVSAENDTKFTPYNSIASASPRTTYSVKFIEVPLDVDKLLFEQFLTTIGPVSNVRYL